MTSQRPQGAAADHATPASILSRLAEPVARRLGIAGWVSILSALVWPVQAATVGLVLGDLVAPGVSMPLSPMAGAAVFLLLSALRIGLDWIAQRLTADAAGVVQVDARTTLLARAIRQAPGDAALQPSALASLIAEKLAALGPWATRYRPAFLRARVVPIALLFLALTQSWAAAVILMIAGPLIPLFMALVGMAAQEASERQMIEIGALNRLLIDRIGAITDLRLLGAEARSRDDLAAQSGDLRTRTMAVLRVAFLSSTVLELFAAIGVALVAVYVGLSLIGWMNFGTYGTPMTPAQGIFLLMIAPEYFQPMRDLAAAWHDRAAALAVAGELDEAERGMEQANRLPGTGALATPPASGPLLWQGLRIRPGHAAVAISVPDATILPGEAVAITGPSGAGKTTLLASLAGLIPAQGLIMLGNLRLDDETADSWRAGLAWIPQSPRFADASLRDLITSGRDGDLDTALDTALSAAAAHEIVATLPEGLHTRLGDLGGGVSGGEARRLLIARAHFAHRAVVLADEPTADLDPKTAGKIIAGLLSLRRTGATLIVSSHDPALIGAMDRQISLGDVA